VRIRKLREYELEKREEQAQEIRQRVDAALQSVPLPALRAEFLPVETAQSQNGAPAVAGTELKLAEPVVKPHGDNASVSAEMSGKTDPFILMTR
jgi:hypothetical protein